MITLIMACFANLWHTYKPRIFSAIKGLVVIFAALAGFCLLASLLLKACGVG